MLLASLCARFLALSHEKDSGSGNMFGRFVSYGEGIFVCLRVLSLGFLIFARISEEFPGFRRISWDFWKSHRIS
jgi:hypothetical protein